MNFTICKTYLNFLMGENGPFVDQYETKGYSAQLIHTAVANQEL